MTEAGDVRFRELAREECEALLAKHHLGRLAYLVQRRAEVVPIHYVYADGWLYGRSALGRKLEALQHAPWVAFEVDEVDGLFDWRSVVVHGTFQVLDPEGTAAERAAVEVAISRLRALIPETLTDADPAPARSFLFRISVAELSGREARSGG